MSDSSVPSNMYLFDFIYQCNIQNSKKRKINQFTYCFYFVINLIYFLNIGQINFLSIRFLIFNSTLAIIFGVIFLCIFLQIIFSMLYKIQLFLGIQFELYRFLFFGSLVRYLLYETQFEENLTSGIAVLLLVTLSSITILFTVFITS
jgi:hypothetical protein